MPRAVFYLTRKAQLWYNRSNAEIGRFLCADSLDYLDPHTVGGLNLYAYCGNNPVMNVDPTGHGFWDAFWNVVTAVAVVVVVTAAVVATAGVAAWAVGASATVISAVTTGAAIGGIAAGTSEIVSQCITEGAEKLDIGAVAIETFIGSAHGVVDGIAATTGSVGVRLMCKVSKVTLSGLQATMHSVNNGDTASKMKSNIAKSMAGGVVVQGALIGFDRITGKLSTSVLESLLIDGALQYGAKQRNLTGAIRIISNIWRNKSRIRNAIFKE